MRLSQKITGFLHNGVSTLWYFAVMAVKENFRNYVGRAGRTEGALSDELALLANGPSLADELPRLLAGARAGCDFLAVNYFAEHEAFERLRPAYYVLSDPQFFRASAQRDRVAALYRTLARKVTWPMTLYVQYYNPERFDYRAALPNGHIRIVPFHTQPYRGFRRLEFWLYRHGLGSANFGTVIQHGEYVGLLLGYRTLHLYGVDHTLTEGLTVDRRNRLCRIDRHFYDAGRGPSDVCQRHLPARPLYDGLLHGRTGRAVSRPRGAARLCRLARRTDRQPYAHVDDRRLRTGCGRPALNMTHGREFSARDFYS